MKYSVNIDRRANGKYYVDWSVSGTNSRMFLYSTKDLSKVNNTIAELERIYG